MFRRQSSGNTLGNIFFLNHFASRYCQSFRSLISWLTYCQLIALSDRRGATRGKLQRPYLKKFHESHRTYPDNWPDRFRNWFAAYAAHSREVPCGVCSGSACLTMRTLASRVLSGRSSALCYRPHTRAHTKCTGHVSRALTSNWRNKPPRKTAAARLLSFRFTLSAREADPASEFTLRE